MSMITVPVFLLACLFLITFASLLVALYFAAQDEGRRKR